MNKSESKYFNTALLMDAPCIVGQKGLRVYHHKGNLPKSRGKQVYILPSLRKYGRLACGNYRNDKQKVPQHIW